MKRILPILGLALSVLFFGVPGWAGVEYTGKAHPDPFMDASSATPKDGVIKNADADIAKALAKMTIQGIVVSRGQSMAIVNGKVVKEGMLLQEMRVVSIEADGINLESSPGNKKFKLAYKRKGIS